MKFFKFFKLIFFCSLVYSAKIVQGEEVLTLKNVLDKAQKSNLTLEAARKELRILEGRLIQARAVPNPKIEGTVDQIATQDPQFSDSAREIGVDQTIEIGNKRSLRTKISESELEAAKARYQGSVLELLRQVKESYWDYSLAEERVSFAQENLKFQQRFFARIQDRFQTGGAKLADVARDKLEVAKANNDLLVAQKNLKSAQSKLNSLMGQEIHQSLPIPQHLEENILDLKEENLQQEALQNRTERKAFTLLQQGAQAELSLSSRLLWTPDLEAGLVYQSGQRNDNRDSWGGHLGLVVPLWYRYRGERFSAKSHLESLQAHAQEIDLAISLQIRQAFLELNLSAEQIRLWRQAVDEATEAARLAEQQYLEGNADLLVFVQARRELVNVTLNYLESLRNYQANLAGLSQAVGKDLEAR